MTTPTITTDLEPLGLASESTPAVPEATPSMAEKVIALVYSLSSQADRLPDLLTQKAELAAKLGAANATYRSALIAADVAYSTESAPLADSLRQIATEITSAEEAKALLSTIIGDLEPATPAAVEPVNAADLEDDDDDDDEEDSDLEDEDDDEELDDEEFDDEEPEDESA